MNPVEPIRDLAKIQTIKKILRSEKDPRNYLLFVAGINLGLRIGDLLSLKVEDVLNGKGRIKEKIYIKEQKTKRNAELKINDSARKALEYYFSIHKKRALKPKEYLFLSRTGRKLDRIRAYQLINGWCRLVGLDEARYGTHTLRKTWGYQARKRGIDLSLIQEKLGHQSPAVTKRYLGITQDEISEIEDKICL